VPKPTLNGIEISLVGQMMYQCSSTCGLTPHLGHIGMTDGMPEEGYCAMNEYE